jgi:putative acetyltransferase
MVTIKRTDSDDPLFRELVKSLDAELAVVDGSDHNFYSQFNKIDRIRNVVIALESEKPVGCGAIKEYKPGVMEVKRMYVTPSGRKKGIATVILNDLEKWAAELSCDRCILETGKRQPEAIGLYSKNGYKRIPNYDQYEGVDNSVCFEKWLKQS